MDLIVYRALLFDKLKTKQSVRTELKQKVLVSQHPGMHYDGILSLVLKAVHYSKVFIGESSAVQGIADTLVAKYQSFTACYRLEIEAHDHDQVQETRANGAITRNGSQ